MKSRHLHGRCPIRTAYGQGRGGDQTNQPRADSFMANTHLHVDHTAATRTSPRWASRSLRVKSSAKNWHVHRRRPMAIRLRRGIRPHSPS